MRSAAPLALFALLSMNLATDSANAAIEYELIQESSGDIMATMVLDPDPQVRDIVLSDLPLTLTLLPLGASVIELPEGTYTMNTGYQAGGEPFNLVDFGDGILRYRTNLLQGVMLFENAPWTPGELAVFVTPQGLTTISNIGQSTEPGTPYLGKFVRGRTVVPEPSSVMVWTMCLVVGLGFGSLRRRRTRCCATRS